MATIMERGPSLAPRRPNTVERRERLSPSGDICRVWTLLVRADGKFVLILLPEGRRPDPAKVAMVLGHRFEPATAEECAAVFDGCGVDEIDPFRAPVNLIVYVDYRVAEARNVVVTLASGKAERRFRYRDYAEAARPGVADLTTAT